MHLPKEPGWYWFRYRKDREWVIVHVVIIEGEPLTSPAVTVDGQWGPRVEPPDA